MAAVTAMLLSSTMMLSSGTAAARSLLHNGHRHEPAPVRDCGAALFDACCSPEYGACAPGMVCMGDVCEPCGDDGEADCDHGAADLWTATFMHKDTKVDDDLHEHLPTHLAGVEAQNGYYGSDEVKGYYGGDVAGYYGAEVKGYYGGDVAGYYGGDVAGYYGGDVKGYYGGDVAGYYGGDDVLGYYGSDDLEDKDNHNLHDDDDEHYEDDEEHDDDEEHVHGSPDLEEDDEDDEEDDDTDVVETTQDPTDGPTITDGAGPAGPTADRSTRTDVEAGPEPERPTSSASNNIAPAGAAVAGVAALLAGVAALTYTKRRALFGRPAAAGAANSA